MDFIPFLPDCYGLRVLANPDRPNTQNCFVLFQNQNKLCFYIINR